jgi:hypothetical protein
MHVVSRIQALFIFLLATGCAGAPEGLAGIIDLSGFSGNETVITMDEIPRTYLNIEEPSDSWLASRLVKGVYLRGGRDFGLPGSLRPFESPFGLPPTQGSPEDFSTASQGVALSFSALSYYFDYTFTLDFSHLPELPKRVGFLCAFSSTYNGGPSGNVTNPGIRLSVSVQGSTVDWYSIEAGRRLLAFEDPAGISGVSLAMVGWLDSFYGIYTPPLTIDDVRFEAVPEPSTYALTLAGIACGGFSMWRRRKRHPLAA